MKDPWFGAKAYGIGIGPKSGAGWAVTGAYALSMIVAPKVVVGIHGPGWVTFGVMLMLTIGFVIVVVSKGDGEPWRWRWGRE